MTQFFFERSLDWGIDPVRVFPMQITSFTLPVAQYDSA